MSSPRHTVLFPVHRQLHARMTEFSGFEMPVSYSGIIEEHLAVRSAAGLFDLSHMGEFEVSGPSALDFLERALTNSAARIAEGHAQYSLMCAPDGGTIDDLIVYRLGPQRYMLCVNAGNIEIDRDWLLELNQGRADFRDVSEQTALVAVQGPLAAEIVASLTNVEIAKLGRFAVTEASVAGVQAVVARTGYTGEDGFELFIGAESATALFAAIMEAGSAHELKPVGLGARDTLRLEAGLPLYGHELDRATSPIEAGLDSFVKLGRDFIGSSALRAQHGGELRKRLIGLRTDDSRTVARQGYRLFRQGREAGHVTSGTFAPSFGRPLAMGYVALTGSLPTTEPGDRLEVEVRGKMVPATVTALPFYRRGRKAQ